MNGGKLLRRGRNLLLAMALAEAAAMGAPHPPDWLKPYLLPRKGKQAPIVLADRKTPAGASAFEIAGLEPNLLKRHPRGVLLLRETWLRVRRNGHIRGRYRLVYRIMRPQGRDLANYVIYESPAEHIRRFRAWEVPAEGKTVQLRRKQAVMVNADVEDPGYTDSFSLVQELPDPQPGAVIAYDIRDRQQPEILEHDWSFQQDVPVLDDRLALTLPSGWEYKARWRNWTAQAPQRQADGSLLWDLRQVPAVRSEPLMPPPTAVAGSLSLTFIPPHPMQALSPVSWPAVGQWYSQLTTGLRQPDPAISAAVDTLTRGQTSLPGKVQALAQYVQHQIRYVSIDIGKIGGYRPHPAAEVYAHSYGDCKDKATLLMSLLRGLHVKAHYVLLNHARGNVDSDPASLQQFDHAIVAIDWPQSLPTDGLYAVENTAGAGRMLFFDPTYDDTPWGWLPTSEQGGQALLVRRAGSLLVPLPVLPATLNRNLRDGNLMMQADGSLQGTFEEIRNGSYANRGIEMIHMQPERRSRLLNDRLNRVIPGAQVEGWKGQNQQGTVVLSYALQFSPYLQISGNTAMLQPWLLPLSAPRLHENHARQYPVRLSYERSISDYYHIHLADNLRLPPGTSLPPDQHLSLRLPGSPAPQPPALVYSSHIGWKTTAQGPELQLVRNLTVNVLKLPAAEYPAFRHFWHAVRRDENRQLMLQIAPSAAPPVQH